MKPTLSTEPARQLTSRECAKIIGGVIGGLTDTASVNDVRTAIRWWAENDESWKNMQEFRDTLTKLDIAKTGVG